jgi:ferredoxin
MSPESAPQDGLPVLAPGPCIGCGDCALACDAGALKVMMGKAQLRPERCTGCGDCYAVCHHQALFPPARG